jgi:hypothetical protein
MTTLQKKLAPQSFTLQGEFLGFFEPGNRAKYLQLATPKGAVFLSVSPQAQKTLPLELGYNQMIQVLVHSPPIQK